MGESTFIKLEYEAKDKGQRIEIDIVVAAADVERAMEGFYDLMARVKQVGAPACLLYTSFGLTATVIAEKAKKVLTRKK